MGIFSSIGGGLVNAGIGFLSSRATDKATRAYRDALFRNIAQNNLDAANQTAQARGYQQAAAGQMATLAAESNEQNRALQGMGANASAAAAQAAASQRQIASLASQGAQQTLAASQRAQSNANTMNNAIRGEVAGIAKQHISDVQQMYQNLGQGVNDIVQYF